MVYFRLIFSSQFFDTWPGNECRISIPRVPCVPLVLNVYDYNCDPNHIHHSDLTSPDLTVFNEFSVYL
jgi:hypothetical protein